MIKYTPTAFNFGYDFVLLVHFLWHPVESSSKSFSSIPTSNLIHYVVGDHLFILNNIFMIISNTISNINTNHKKSSVSTLTPLCILKVAFLVGILFKDYAGFLLPDQIYTSALPRWNIVLDEDAKKMDFWNMDMMIMMPGILAHFFNDNSSDCKSSCQIFIIHYWIFIPRKQHINSNTKSHSVDYNLLPQVILFIRETWKRFVITNFFQEPELCPECPELPYSTDTKFWSQNPYVENSLGNENSYSVQNFNYGLNSIGATDDLIEIPPDPFSHQSYSRRIDSLALDALDIGGRRNGVQVIISEDLLKDYCNFFQMQILSDSTFQNIIAIFANIQILSDSTSTAFPHRNLYASSFFTVETFVEIQMNKKETSTFWIIWITYKKIRIRTLNSYRK